jgi:tetratricopeptide (TPR) repeat protein
MKSKLLALAAMYCAAIWKRRWRINPRSVGNRWNLMHVERLLGKMREVERQAAELISLDPAYAAAYLELGQAYEMERNIAKAVDAYDAYVLLAPNFADTDSVRVHSERLRGR